MAKGGRIATERAQGGEWGKGLQSVHRGGWMGGAGGRDFYGARGWVVKGAGGFLQSVRGGDGVAG